MENQTEEKKTVLSEFVEKYIKIENEQKLLAEDRKYWLLRGTLFEATRCHLEEF